MKSCETIFIIHLFYFRGLDSLSTLQCIHMLKELAKGGRTIICTIHQPSATIYNMFDHIYMMTQGRCVYQGSSLNTVAYLSSLGFHCPQYHNPCDYCKYKFSVLLISRIILIKN